MKICTVHREISNNKVQFVGEYGAEKTLKTHSLNSDRAYVIPRGSVFLFSMSPVDVFRDTRLLSNIHTDSS